MERLMLLDAVLALSSCTQARAPSSPQVSTEAGKVCIRECQVIYSGCNGTCGPGAVNQTRRCFDNCNQTLADCYAAC